MTLLWLSLIHILQEGIEYVRMRLLYRIEENHTIWFAAYSLGQLTTFSVTRLIGAPPGYVGYDEGGQLTEAVPVSYTHLFQPVNPIKEIECFKCKEQ